VQTESTNIPALPVAVPAESPDSPFADMAAGTAIFVIALGILVLVYLLFRERRRQQLIAMFLERGQTVPSTLLPRAGSRHAEIRRGTWLIGLALGVGAVLWIASGTYRYAVWGLIPLCLGTASFINAAFFYPRHDPRE